MQHAERLCAHRCYRQLQRMGFKTGVLVAIDVAITLASSITIAMVILTSKK